MHKRVKVNNLWLKVNMTLKIANIIQNIVSRKKLRSNFFIKEVVVKIRFSVYFLPASGILKKTIQMVSNKASSNNFEVYLYANWIRGISWSESVYTMLPGHRTSTERIYDVQKSPRTSSERLTYIQFRLSTFRREGASSRYSNIATRWNLIFFCISSSMTLSLRKIP